MKYVLAVLAMCLCLAGCSKDDENTMPEFKTCVYCQETDIKRWAVKCKHCGEDPDGPDGEVTRAEWRRIEKEAREAASTPRGSGDYGPPPKMPESQPDDPIQELHFREALKELEEKASRAHNSDKNSTPP